MEFDSFLLFFKGQLCRNGVDINLIHQTLDKKLLRVKSNVILIECFYFV
jgi:hypothetical protein